MQRAGRTQDWRVSRSWGTISTQGLFLQPWVAKDTETVWVREEAHANPFCPLSQYQKHSAGLSCHCCGPRAALTEVRVVLSALI